MSSFSEQDPVTDDPEFHYTPLRLSKRAAKLGPAVSQGATSEPIRSSPISRPALLDPKAINETASTRDLDRRAALFGVAARVAAVAVVVASVLLLFVMMKLASRQSVADSTPSDITGSMSTALPQSDQGDVESKPALAEFQAFLAPTPRGQPATDEQSQQLLQQFLQWREKANTTGTARDR